MIKILELFAGIGACSTALKYLNIGHEIVDAVEIDKYAIKSFNAVHNTNFEVQDICTWNKDIEVDLIMHGSPCQDFSIAGRQSGGDVGSGTRSSLMYETIRIVHKLMPKYVIWENVKNLLSKKHRHNFDSYLDTMKNLGYTSYYQVLNAKDYGVPQNRERVFTISIRNDINTEFDFPPKQELKIRLKDVLEDNVEEQYYLNDAQVERMNTTNYESSKFEHRVTNEDGITPTLCARDYKDPKCVQEIIVDHSVKPSVAKNFEREKEKIFKSDKDIYEIRCKKGFTDNRIGLKISPTICSSSSCVYGLKNYRIRKLTPKEFWRLMGFNDEDFEKAAKVNSNTQLYKQAGNSICVPVLQAILQNLLKEGEV